MKIVIFNILFLSLAFQLSCSKDVPKVVNPNSNYQFNCPKINSICPFRNNIGEENWILVNSGITPIPNDSYIRVDSKNRILEYHVNNRYFFGYQFQTDPNDCSSIFVKDRPDAKDLRTIRTIANDSMIIIYDPIICPNEGCIAIKNSKYSNYAYANLKKLGCQNIDYKNINCPCSDDKTGFQCKSKFHYLDIFSEEFTLCAQKLKNNNIVILTRGDSKLSLVCIDKSKNIIWKTDLSNFFSYFGLKHKFDQNQILEDINGNILVILPKSNSQLELVLNVVVINQFGKIINTVSNNIAKASDNNYVKVIYFPIMILLLEQNLIFIDTYFYLTRSFKVK
ncbi:MAG: hypothetical protein IPH98_17550 [Saprospiraceae bacterium]|nr:hypothetical protein [Candidatus Defluviibacterium haderslevense]